MELRRISLVPPSAASDGITAFALAEPIACDRATIEPLIRLADQSDRLYLPSFNRTPSNVCAFRRA